VGDLKKQTISGTIYIYLGVLIGFVTSGLIFPRILMTDQIGLLSVLVSYSLIFSQFASLGFVSVTTRFFSFFRDEKNKHNGFFFLAIMVTLIGFILMLAVFFLIKDRIIENSIEKSPLLGDYVYSIIPLFAVSLFFNILDTYYKVLYNAVIGIYLKELVQRLAILISLGFFYFGIIDFNMFVYIYVLCFAVPFIGITVALILNKKISLKPKLSFVTKDLMKKMLWMGFFGIITSASGMITLSIDRIMIDRFLGLDYVGIYSTVFFFGTLVIMPARSMNKVASPFIADAWKEKNLRKINDIYHRTSMTQFVVGLLLLAGLWVNIDNVFEILPPAYLPGKYVILFIGMAYLFDMAIGANSSVINNSEYYYVNGIIMIFQVLLIIVTNLVFIRSHGIVGAAFASALTKLVVSVLRYFFVLFRFKMQPYNYKFLLALGIGLASYGAGYYIPVLENYVYDIILRSAITGLVFVVLTLAFKISEDINERAKTYWEFFLKRVS